MSPSFPHGRAGRLQGARIIHAMLHTPPDARVSAGVIERGNALQDKPLVSCLIAE